jgi:carboxypeptidase D
MADAITRPMAFFDQLATNASMHGIGVVIYSGNDDSLVSHWSSEGTPDDLS